ncbi:hypothetical protein VTO42DRAFT_6948 [Malbranchea cinnamomea]
MDEQQDPVRRASGHSAEWAGCGTIAEVTKESIENFNSLPPETHERLRQATTRLIAEKSFVQRHLNGKSPYKLSVDTSSLSAAEKFEVARHLVDFPPNEQPQKVSEEPYVDFVDHLVSLVPQLVAKPEQIAEIDRTSTTLMEIANGAMRTYLGRIGLPTDPMPVTVVSCGSYFSGSAMVDSHVDLLVKPTLKRRFPFTILCHYFPRLLAKHLVEQGFCATLAPSPHDAFSIIVKVCEKSDPALLQTLRRQYVTEEDFPSSVYFSESRGKQYNFYFSADNSIFTASDLMACYYACDPRVGEMACIIKKWAKMRRIHGLENGFLSSYGYELMLLHFLLHVDDVPVVPNLQYTDLGVRNSKYVCKRTISYWDNRDEIRIKAQTQVPKNRRSTNSLLRGFFAFYSGQRLHGDFAAIRPFNWKYDVVTIGDKPRVSKEEKGWPRFFMRKVQRWCYLAIEDPCNVDHNVAEFVSPMSMKIMKEEFARAHTMLCKIKFVPGTGFQWRTENGTIGGDFFDSRNPSASELEFYENPPARPLNHLRTISNELKEDKYNQNWFSARFNPRNMGNRDSPVPGNRQPWHEKNNYTSIAGDLPNKNQPSKLIDGKIVYDGPQFNPPPSMSSFEDNSSMINEPASERQSVSSLREVDGNLSYSSPMTSRHRAVSVEDLVDIPQAPFKLDPMQLRDLAKIAAGGSGCERSGKSGVHKT